MSESQLSEPDQALLSAARDVREHAHAPISNYRVGASVRTASGQVIAGCNVEHIILSMSACAEVVAVYTAIAAGHRDFGDAAVFTSSSPPATPCGRCRQLLHGWGIQRVLCGNSQGEVVVHLMSDLLPHAFDLHAPLAQDVP